MRTRIAIAGLALALHAAAAVACGHCVEDKIASVYDHAMIKGALARDQQVAFFAINGDFPANETSKKAIESGVRSVDGIDKNGVKVSVDTASLSVVFNPKERSIDALQKSIEKKLTGKKLTLELMKVMTTADKLKTASR